MTRTILRFVVSGILLATMGTGAPADDATDEAIKKERKLIEGTWRVVAIEIDGNKSTDAGVSKVIVVNGPDGTWSLRVDGKEISKGTSMIDPSRHPRQIDFLATDGESKDSVFLGVYDLGEKTRTLCFAPSGKARPTELASTPGSQHILVTFEREPAR